MAEKLIHIFRALLRLLFPQKCLGCGTEDSILCDKCLENLPRVSGCESGSHSQKWIFSATSYQEDMVKKAIRLFKYHEVKILAEKFAELMYRRFKEILSKDFNYKPGYLIIPVPLSKRRLRERGYNQTELIGKALSDKLSVKMAADILYKIKDTPSQVEIKDRKKRLENLKGAFAIKNPEIIKNKIIILIDDISTTGATLNETKRVLTQAGVKKVIGLVVAKG